MDSRHLVDPELRPMIDAEPAVHGAAERLEENRAAVMDMFTLNSPPESKPDRLASAPRLQGEGEVPLRIFYPSTELRLRPAILEIHGGGFLFGAAAISDVPNRAFASRHDAVVIAVDYRLAPETPFPGPLEDCYAALAWVVANAEPLGIDLERLIVLGASAGGGLAAALAQLVRDRGEYRLSAQFLIYPMIDHRTGSPDDPYNNPLAGQFGWTRESNQFGWASMRGTAPIEDSRLGHFSPANARTLAGLPPTFIAVGALDLFLDEDIAYASRLIREGVPTELHVYPGAPHGFNLLETADVAKRFNLALAGALDRVFRKEPPAAD
jgi:triacylglycerol lipase